MTNILLEASVFRALCTSVGWDTYHTLVYDGLWNKNLYRTLYTYLKQLHESEKRDYTPSEVQAYVTSVVRLPDKLDEFNALFDQLLAAPVLSGQVLRKCVNQFVSREKALQVAHEIAQGHSNPEFDPLQPLQTLQDAVKVYGSIDIPPVEDYLQSSLPDIAVDRPKLTPLGLSSKLDEAIGGGVAAGEICILLAAPKKGKTSLLSIVGANAALTGKRVLHITLEVSKEMAERRYDSALSKLDYASMLVNPAVVRAGREKIAKTGGAVFFVDWQYEEHSPSELIPLVDYCGQIDLLVLDYLELMIPDRTKTFSRKEQRHLYSKLGKDIRGVAKLLNIPVLTAWQVNRAGSNSDMVGPKDTSESWDIMKHADTVVGISRSSAERENRIMRVHTTEIQRFGTKHYEARFRVDLLRNQLEELDG